MLTYAKVQVAATIGIFLEITSLFEGQTGLRRRRQISRPTHQPWHTLRNGIQNLPTGVSSSRASGVSGICRDILVPAIGEPTFLNQLQLLGQIRIGSFIGGELGVPCRFLLRPT